VAVSEEEQADYLVRFYLLALGTGLVERVYWWRLVARGYGLIAPEPHGALRRRPAYRAMKTLAAELAGSVFSGPMVAPDGVRLYRFDRDGETVVVAWSVDEGGSAQLPAPARRAIGRDGDEVPIPDDLRIVVGPSPVYYVLAE
jgi:hypothetical protein